MQNCDLVSRRNRFTILAAVAGALALCACASGPPPTDPDARAAYVEANDRREPINRKLLAVDSALDRVFFRPLIKGYDAVFPRGVRRSIDNFLENLRLPAILINDILEGEAKNATLTTERLVINSTVGLGGLFDVATPLGLKPHYTDFGITLALWGVGEGGYSYMPVLGPSTFRDSVGMVVDTFLFNPVAWYSYNSHNEHWPLLAELGLIALDDKSLTQPTVNELKACSLDYYVVLRSVYRQHRDQQIRSIRPSWAHPLPTMEDDDPFLVTTPNVENRLIKPPLQRADKGNPAGE